MTLPRDAADDLKTLEERSYATYKARIKTSERLAARGQSWNASMYAFSSALAVAAIGSLSGEDPYGSQGDVLMAGLSVLSLVAGLVVGQLNYAVRSRNAELDYKKLQFVSQEAELARAHDTSLEAYTRIHSKYAEIISSSENHTTGDYWRSQNKAWTHFSCYREALVTVSPFATLAIPFVLLWVFLRSVLA